MLKKIFPLVIAALFAFIAVVSLLHEGLPPTHDGEYHIVRFYEFDKTLRSGDWYPRWAPDLNNGYGVPLFNYVYPLPNYAASILHFLGFSFIDSFKLNMFFATILGAVFFYLWSRGFWGDWGGVAGAVFYTYSPYHFLDIYIRGSVGEVWALAFFPAFLWGVTKFVRDRKQHFLPIASVFLALIIFSHNILALMFFPFALSYYGFLLLGDKGNKAGWGKGIFVFLLGIGLSSIFWLPAILERQYVTGLEIFDTSAHFPDLYQLLIPSWGSGFSGENTGNQMSFQIGIANLIVVFLSLFVMVFRHSGLSALSLRERVRMRGNGATVIIFFLVWFFIIFFLMLKVSLPIWQTVPFMNYFQFPWRLLSLEILISSFLAGSVVHLITQTKFKKLKLFIALCLIILTFSLGIGYARPAHYLYRDDNYYITRSNFIDGTNSPGNVFNTIFFDTSLDKEKAKIKFLKGEGEIEQETIGVTRSNFVIEAVESSEVQVNTAYFPGWRVFVNKKETKVYKTKNGLFSFGLPKGYSVVDIQFGDTFVRKMGFFLSLISLSAVIVCFINLKKLS